MRHFKLITIVIYLLLLNFINAGPKLVVGIVVDQMRYDFLYRFNENYGSGGFKRLMNEGANFTFAHYNFVPTYTAVGHSSVYTGTTPFYNGITGNEIYDPNTGEVKGAVEDDRYKVLTRGNDEGGCSPLKLFSTTIGDELKISNNGLSKVISISIKDRAAVLPGGRLGDAAYWYDHSNGEFVTSEYYMKQLPKWLIDFNNKKLSQQYMQKEWNLSLPIEKYRKSFPDEAEYELDVFNEGRKSFPHLLKNVKDSDKPGSLISTPYGNQLLIDLAMAVLDNEYLGRHDVPDLLCISFSSTDYVGHQFGHNSIEVQDLYIKLDKQIADLLNALDEKVGKGNYTLFLTGDHGASGMQRFMKKSDEEYADYDSIKKDLRKYAKEKYGSNDIILKLLNKQVFLNYKFILEKELDVTQVRKDIVQFMKSKYPSFVMLFTRDDIAGQTPRRDNNNHILNGFNSIRSGDIFFELPPVYYLGKNIAEATHGTSYSYDTHMPMIFFGYGVKSETNNTSVFICDIAPTIADILKITEPSGCIGIPLIKK